VNSLVGLLGVRCIALWNAVQCKNMPYDLAFLGVRGVLWSLEHLVLVVR
jgi:hypothetical protein